jgi:hypothetical protein
MAVAGERAALCLPMDIIASIFAYLGCVTGIVGALAISFFFVFSPLAQPATAPQVASHAASVAPAPAKTVAASETSAVAKSAKAESAKAENTAKAENKADDRGGMAAVAKDRQSPPLVIAQDARQKTKTSHAQWRRLVQEERAKRWAYQQDPDFEARFLGYAD